MQKQMNKWMISIYCAVSSFVQELKDDERGISGAVVAVLLVVVAIAAVAIIWTWMSGFLQPTLESMNGEASKIGH